MSFRNEFLEFLEEYGVLGLAIAFVIGVAVKDLVSATVDGLIMPGLDPLLAGEQWEDAIFTVSGINFRVGLFLSALIDFLVVAFLVFLFVKYLLGKEELENI